MTGHSPAVGRGRNHGHGDVRSPSPRRERAGPENSLVSSLQERSPGYGGRRSPSPQRERREKYSPDGKNRGSSPIPKPEPAESPVRDGRGSSEQYWSCSPPAQERSRS